MHFDVLLLLFPLCKSKKAFLIHMQIYVDYRPSANYRAPPLIIVMLISIFIGFSEQIYEYMCEYDLGYYFKLGT